MVVDGDENDDGEDEMEEVEEFVVVFAEGEGGDCDGDHGD